MDGCLERGSIILKEDLLSGTECSPRRSKAVCRTQT